MDTDENLWPVPADWAPCYDAGIVAEPYDGAVEYLEDILAYIRAYLRLYYLAVLMPAGDEILICADEVNDFLAFIDNRRDVSLAGGLLLPPAYLCSSFRLNEAERFALYFAFAAEVDDGIAEVARRLQGWPNAEEVCTIGFAFQLYHLERSLPLSFLASFRQTNVLALYFWESGTGDTEELRKPAKLDRRIIDFFFSQASEDTLLKNYTTYAYPDSPLPVLLADEDIPVMLADYVSRARAEGTGTDGGRKKTMFHLSGQEGCGKKLQVRSYCADKRQTALIVDLAALLSVAEAAETTATAGAPGWLTTARLCRETVLKRAVLCFDHFDEVIAHGRMSWFMQLLEGASRYSREVFLLSEEAWKPGLSLPGAFHYVPIGIQPLNPLRRLAIWRQLSAPYPMDPDLRLSDIANKFSFSIGQIGAALDAAASSAQWNRCESIDEDTLHAACYSLTEHKLQDKAQRIRPKYTWDDLVLPQAQKNIIRLACSQLRYRHRVYNEWGFETKISYGTGIFILFSGAPGTGKTMAAEVMALDLKLELYKVDLSALVSKYIGETEKNISDLFAQAKRSDAILFFDEADTLFAKRTEVTNANDRNANMETSFLLQKMEEYSGIIILATNFQQNFDVAFKRRIKLIVHFEMPGPAYRKIIWESVFPADMPRDSHIDFDFLADKFEISGSNIKNIVLNAAFLAADEGGAVDMPRIVRALQLEYSKSGLMLRKEDLGEYAAHLYSSTGQS